jgi:peroxiredoxin
MVLIDDNSHVLRIGDEMPPFSLPATSGETIDASALKERVIVVVFTCNHCPYAQKEELGLIELQKNFAEQQVRFVLISSNDADAYPDDNFDAMRDRAEEKQYPFPYCQDATQQVAKAFGALCTPHVFVFDSKRRLAYKGGVAKLGEALVDLTADRPVARPEANAIGCSIKWKPGNEPPVIRH